MIGDYDKHTTSSSVGRGSRSTSHQVQRERTLDVADLGAFPPGRAVVFASGAPATWPHAAALRASIAAHDPASQPVALSPTTGVSAPAETPPRGRTLALRRG